MGFSEVGYFHSNSQKWAKIKHVLCLYSLPASLMKSDQKWSRYRPDNIFIIICLWETKGQVTFMWIVWSAPNSNWPKILWLCLVSTNLINQKRNRCRPDNIFLSLWGPLGRVSCMPMVEWGPKSSLSGILYLSLLSASSMKILSKKKLLSFGQHFHHYMSMGD